MKKLEFTFKKSAKPFLLKMLPAVLAALGVAPTQSFYGFKVNIEAELIKRINAMPESTAKLALDTLKRLLQEW